MRHACFEVIGKLVYAGIDCDGNIHIILKKNDAFWRNVAVRYLKTEENHIVKMRILPWSHKKSSGSLKNSRRNSNAVNKE